MDDFKKCRAVESIIDHILASEWQRLIHPFLKRRIMLYLEEVELQLKQRETQELCQPTYYVGHPDGSFSVADPQPELRSKS